jgi:lysozyme
MSRRINAAGLELIKSFEDCVLTTYKCSAAKCTIGYGHTGDDVRMGMTITQERAEELLRQDLATAERAVAELVKVPITANQHAVLVSFVFNVGAGALRSSTLLRMLNNRLYTDAGNQLTRWIYAGGQIVGGLRRRRNAERDLWFSPD